MFLIPFPFWVLPKLGSRTSKLVQAAAALKSFKLTVSLLIVL